MTDDRDDPTTLEAHAALEAALRAAMQPEPIPAERHEAMLRELGLVTDDEENRDAALLAEALDGAGEHPEARLAAALRNAVHPEPLSPAALENAIATALEKGSKRQRRNVLYVTFAGAASALALAASVLLVVDTEPGPERPLELVPSRSLSPLFAAGDAGTASERLDRITTARARDLRANRYAAWGVP